MSKTVQRRLKRLNDSTSDSLKNLYRKHKNQNANRSDNQSIIERAFTIYGGAQGPKQSLSINTMLKLLVHFKHCHRIESMWADIEQIGRKNTVSCPSIIKCFVLSDHWDKTSKCIQVLQWMVDSKYTLKRYEWNDFSLSISKLITFCADTADRVNVECIQRMMDCLEIEDLFIQTALVNALGALSDIEGALNVFHSISDRKKDVVVTGCLMKALIDNDRAEEALRVYDDHRDLIDDALNVLALKSCIRIDTEQSFERGKAILSAVGNTKNLKFNNISIAFYGHFGDFEGAMTAFNAIGDGQKDVVSIGTAMKILIDHQRDREALTLYKTTTVSLDEMCHLLALRAFGNVDEEHSGLALIEAVGLESKEGLFVKSALIDFHGKFQRIESAQNVFDSVPDSDRNIVIIGAMMEALYGANRCTECLALFETLQSVDSELVPNAIVYGIALKACTEGTNYNLGTRIHGELKRVNDGQFLRDLSVQIQLINLYGKCAAMKEAECIFEDIKTDEADKYRSEISIWNAMVQGHARNGDVAAAQRVAAAMRRETELRADHKTLSLLLSACSHSGDVSAAMDIWTHWSGGDEHKYDCFVITSLVDCHSRAGRWDEAMTVIREFQQRKEGVISDKDHFPMWMALLSGLVNDDVDNPMVQDVYDEMESIFGKESKIMIPAAMLLSRVHSKTFRTENNVK